MKTWIPAERFLPYMTWRQVDALPRDKTLLVLPTAAIEQHGHHLPLATDTLLNNYLLGRALELLAPDAHVYALAPVCYGKSNEHVGFPGTLSLSGTTFAAVLRDVAASLHAAGFRKIVLFNTHGGNHSLVDVMARDLRDEFGLRMFCLFGGGPASGLNPQEAAFGFHAGEVETALLLAATPELVHTDRYTVNYIARVGDKGVLKPEFAYATFAWLTRDIAPSGVMGDPNPATAENGLKWREEMAARIASALAEMAVHELPAGA
jgi:creatinine amidohydrolase